MRLDLNPELPEKVDVTFDSMQERRNLFDNAPIIIGRFSMVRAGLGHFAKIRYIRRIFKPTEYEFPEVVTMSFDELRGFGDKALRLSQKWNKPWDTCTETKIEVAKQITEFLDLPLVEAPPSLELVA